MSHVHVCLVSEQTIPNILGIYHFKPDRVVFCSTSRMEREGKTDAIINTLKLYKLDYSKASERVIVNQDSLEDCELKFASEITQKYKDIRLTVNLTGGTKIMVLGAYNVFRENAEQMIYTPIPRNEFLAVYPKSVDCKIPMSLDLRLSVEAYVTAYGIKVKNSNKIGQSKSNARRNENLCTWIVESYTDIEDLLIELYGKLKEHRDNRNFKLKTNYIPRNQKEREFLKRLGMTDGKIDKTLSREEIRFITGDWLSDFCFNEIYKLSVDDCVTGIEIISSKGTDNEFDVMFTKDNALYIVECKSLRQSHDKDADILYKISALQHDFGLRVKGFLVSTARSILYDSNNIKESILRRARQCNAEVIHPDSIRDMNSWIKKYVKGF